MICVEIVLEFLKHLETESLGDVSGQEIVVEVLNQQRHFANLGLAALELQPARDPLAKVNLLV